VTTEICDGPNGVGVRHHDGSTRSINTRAPDLYAILPARLNLYRGERSVTEYLLPDWSRRSSVQHQHLTDVRRGEDRSFLTFNHAGLGTALFLKRMVTDQIPMQVSDNNPSRHLLWKLSHFSYKLTSCFKPTKYFINYIGVVSDLVVGSIAFSPRSYLAAY
jgi:hypothetical protein